MNSIFEAINRVFAFIGPLSDFLWDFPTNFSWYKNIPIIGNFSFAIILLVGSGIYFSFRIGFMQVTYFKKGIKTMTEKRAVKAGISPLAAFFLSSAMRVGPGNIIGVTGAIAVGGPGALFWMWISAFFGMAVAYMEAVLAQMFKEKRVTSWSAAFRSTEESSSETKPGSAFSFRFSISCTRSAVSPLRALTSFPRSGGWQKSPPEAASAPTPLSTTSSAGS